MKKIDNVILELKSVECIINLISVKGYENYKKIITCTEQLEKIMYTLALINGELEENNEKFR